MAAPAEVSMTVKAAPRGVEEAELPSEWVEEAGRGLETRRVGRVRAAAARRCVESPGRGDAEVVTVVERRVQRVEGEASVLEVAGEGRGRTRAQ